ncbi:DMT family transporter [Rhizobium lusitanum]|uniref:Drug/metabolite transporter (DMT)-like permease n=1 Tax=Rhizobium lusitanum TaxID=293958 RepID=A0A7X0MEJ4_9HYPH|nr:DMT family transporter [Rhizobium lusitanum]MBB6486068.1 drug/metabolite transporter (DMT)-like permease [Rhizobium lusitanum]
MMGDQEKPNRRLALAAGLTMVAITAIQFVAARFSLREHLTSADITSLRFSGAALAFAPIIWRTGLAKMKALRWRRATVLALLAGFPYPLIINTGLTYAPASHAAAICPASIVFFSFLLARIVFRDAVSGVRSVGIMAIIGGLALFALPGNSDVRDAWRGDILFAGSGMMFSAYAVLLRRWAVDAVTATAAVIFLSCLPMPFVHFLAPTGFGSASAGEIGIQLAIQGLLAGAAAIFLYSYAVRQLGPHIASLFMPCIPIATTLTGTMVLQEIPTPIQLIAILIMIAGMAAPALLRT